MVFSTAMEVQEAVDTEVARLTRNLLNRFRLISISQSILLYSTTATVTVVEEAAVSTMARESVVVGVADSMTAKVTIDNGERTTMMHVAIFGRGESVFMMHRAISCTRMGKANMQ